MGFECPYLLLESRRRGHTLFALITMCEPDSKDDPSPIKVASIDGILANPITMPPYQSTSKPERRRRIFLAARTVFVGHEARVRDRAAIKAVISRHPAALKSLQQDFGEQTVVDIIWTLLDNGIFESELKAKLAFPELYQPSQARNLQHHASEQEVARSEAEALNEASRSDIDIHERDQGGPWIDGAGCRLVATGQVPPC